MALGDGRHLGLIWGDRLRGERAGDPGARRPVRRVVAAEHGPWRGLGQHPPARLTGVRASRVELRNARELFRGADDDHRPVRRADGEDGAEPRPQRAQNSEGVAAEHDGLSDPPLAGSRREREHGVPVPPLGRAQAPGGGLTSESAAITSNRGACTSSWRRWGMTRSSQTAGAPGAGPASSQVASAWRRMRPSRSSLRSAVETVGRVRGASRDAPRTQSRRPPWVARVRAAFAVSSSCLRRWVRGSRRPRRAESAGRARRLPRCRQRLVSASVSMTSLRSVEGGGVMSASSRRRAAVFGWT